MREGAGYGGTVHLYIGTALLLFYLATTIVYAIGIGGTVIPWGKYVSYLASLLLMLQYLLGIGLLASGARNQAIHYALAILVLVPIGLEHGLIRRRFQGRQLAVNLTTVAAITTVVIFITYLIGKSGAT